MNLANIFKRDSQSVRNSDSIKGTEGMSRGERIYRLQNEIRNLQPGQTIQGEVVSRNGKSIQLALANDLLINARIDQNISIALGQSMSFEIKTNNGSILSLSPLYANMANEETIMRALSAAGLPETAENIEMVAKMMEEGMPIDKESVLAMSRLLMEFPKQDLAVLIQMARLEIPVTEANIEQFMNYMNANHQILGSVEDIMGGIPQVFEELLGEGKTQQAYAFYEAVINLFGGEEPAAEEGVVIPKGETAQTQGTGQQILPDGVLPEELLAKEQDVSEEQNLKSGLSEQERNALAGMLKELGVEEKDAEQVKNGSMSDKEILNLVKNLLAKANTGNTSSAALEKLLSGKEFQELLKSEMENQWLLKPKDVADADRVEQLYEKIREQTARLSEALQNAGKADVPAARSVQNLQSNVDFMNQLNHAFTYIQLPLKMAGNHAHGDLYVYTNKKNLAAKDGNVSALLHLDMEHLGPLDVYVTMQQNKVSTNFTLADESCLDLIAEHIHLLNERLAKRGYDLKAQFQVKEEAGEDDNIMQTILNQDKNISVLSRTSFDMRA